MLCSFELAVNAQDYVDIVKFSANTSTLENGLNSETNVNNLNFELYYPKEINENLVLITGITAENTNLNLQPFFERTSITMTRLNLGENTSTMKNGLERMFYYQNWLPILML